MEYAFIKEPPFISQGTYGQNPLTFQEWRDSKADKMHTETQTWLCLIGLSCTRKGYVTTGTGSYKGTPVEVSFEYEQKARYIKKRLSVKYGGKKADIRLLRLMQEAAVLKGQIEFAIEMYSEPARVQFDPLEYLNGLLARAYDILPGDNIIGELNNLILLYQTPVTNEKQ